MESQGHVHNLNLSEGGRDHLRELVFLIKNFFEFENDNIDLLLSFSVLCVCVAVGGILVP